MIFKDKRFRVYGLGKEENVLLRVHGSELGDFCCQQESGGVDRFNNCLAYKSFNSLRQSPSSTRKYRLMLLFWAPLPPPPPNSEGVL